FPAREVHLVAESDHPTELVLPFGKYAAQLDLRSQPKGAVFAVDGLSVGRAPTEADVPMGHHVTVTATLPGYKPWSQKLHVKEGKESAQAKLSGEYPPRRPAIRCAAKQSPARKGARPPAARWPGRSASLRR